MTYALITQNREVLLVKQGACWSLPEINNNAITLPGIESAVQVRPLREDIKTLGNLVFCVAEAEIPQERRFPLTSEMTPGVIFAKMPQNQYRLFPLSQLEAMHERISSESRTIIQTASANGYI